MSHKSIDDSDLIYIVASTFLSGYITDNWSRTHEKAALTKAKIAIKVIKRYLEN